MNIRIVFLVMVITIPIVLSIGIVSKIFAQLDDDQNNSIGLSKQSMIKAHANNTDLTANNKTGFKGESTVGLSGRSIEEAQGNITDLTANKTGFKGESTVGLSGRSIEEANK